MRDTETATTPIILLLVLSVFVHLLPFILYSPHPLGYDTGFYRRYLLQPLESFPNTPVPGLGSNVPASRFFLDILRPLPISPDIILYGSYILFGAVSALILFFLVRYYFGIPMALWAGFLFVLSSVQYTAYWFMFWKQALALTLFLEALFLIEKKSKYVWLLAVVIAASHPTTTILFLITLTVFMLFAATRRREIFWLIFLTFFVFLFLNYKLVFLKSPTAVFINSQKFLILSAPLVLLALFGLKNVFLKLRKTLFGIFMLVAIIFPLFNLPFYERIFIFTDLAIIVIAACGLKKLEDREKNCSKFWLRVRLVLVIAISLGWLLGNLYKQIETLRPVISAEELQELNNLTIVIPPEATILTSTLYAPWVQGWSLNKVLAPGLLGDKYSAQDWLVFWETTTTEAQVKFLEDFPRPLYIFTDPKQKAAFKPLAGCLVTNTLFISKYKC